MIYYELVEHIDNRKSKRLEANAALAMTPFGMCQMINLNKTGLSFKCIDGKTFPDAWSMSIYDAKDLNLEELKVKKIWEKRANGQGISSVFETEIGGEFESLSASQKAQLYSYLFTLIE